ncbi:MAG: AbrB/MazE/SpoVT family DNA-binding domain-containing protein [Candidatus Nanohaloarchaea archaeon]
MGSSGRVVVDERGRVTIPQDLRDQYGIDEGDVLEFSLEPKAVFRPASEVGDQ